MTSPREGWDLVLDLDENPVGLMFAWDAKHPARIGGEVGQQIEEAAPRVLEVPQVWEDWSGGAGYSRALVPGTYEECEFGEASYPLIYTPSGFLQDVELPGAPVAGLVQDEPAFFFQLPTSPGAGTHDLYLGVGRRIYRMPLGTGDPVVDQDFGDTARWCDSAATFEDYAYVSLINGALHRKVAGGVWTGSADVIRTKLAVVNWTIRTSGSVSNGWRLIGTERHVFRHVDLNSDPMAHANWTGQIEVGDPTFPIKSIAASRHHVYFLKDNGPHDVDERGYSPQLASWDSTADWANGTASVVHPSGWLYATHRQGLTRTWIGEAGFWQPGPGWCHFGADLPYEGRIRGRALALALNAGKLVAAFWDDQSNTTYICEAQDRREVGLEGRGPLVWHGAKAILPGKVTTMYVAGLDSKPRIHYGWTDRSGKARYSYQHLPRAASPYAAWKFDEPDQYQFAPRTVLYLPRDPWGQPVGRKRIWGWELETENLVSGNAWTLSASADGGAYVAQGSAYVSPYAEIAPSADPVEGRSIGVKLEGRGGLMRDGVQDLSSPPVLRALRGTAEVEVKLGQYLQYRCVLGEGVQTGNGAADRRDPEVVTEQLIALQDRGAFTMFDRGRVMSVWMLPGLSYEDTQTSAAAWQRIVTFRVRVLARSVRYGTGEQYGSGVTYAGAPGG